MGQTPFRIGFIGGGLNSAVGNTHRIASQMDNRWVLEAGCFSTNDKINRETAAQWGLDKSRVYDDWHVLLRNEKNKLDAVCLLTPTPSHSEMAIEALNNGFPVICEKTLATSSKEAAAICRAIDMNKGFLAVTYNYTGYPMLRELRQMIIDGKLGVINLIQIEMPQEGYVRLNKNGQPPKPQAWRLKDGKIPIISLDLGSHLHNIIYFLTGEKPLQVVADQTSYGFFKDVTDNVICLARYTGNLRSQIWYSKMALGYRNGLRVRVYGKNGSAEWFQLVPEELIFNDVKGRREIIDRASCVEIADQLRYNRFKSGHPDGFMEAFANHYYDLADSLLEFKKTGVHTSPWTFSATIAKEGLEMLEAISQSAKNNRWQKISSSNLENN
ncbi:MAG: gfo/Idh/MocA family oxidoreductase [Deltaproteobacteria bacterium HGW-Deltaproteobacteria-2]|jgi:predicted dehydrogenase|nr:MAG: gfo/Idh/MocA family oxidoreductase [Deltaproteobacteria bacterium HGW-Deltaproteobacteria-2]